MYLDQGPAGCRLWLVLIQISISDRNQTETDCVKESLCDASRLRTNNGGGGWACVTKRTAVWGPGGVGGLGSALPTEDTPFGSWAGLAMV